MAIALLLLLKKKGLLKPKGVALVNQIFGSNPAETGTQESEEWLSGVIDGCLERTPEKEDPSDKSPAYLKGLEWGKGFKQSLQSRSATSAERL